MRVLFDFFINIARWAWRELLGVSVVVRRMYYWDFLERWIRESSGRTHQKLSNEPRYRSPFIGDLTRGTF